MPDFVLQLRKLCSGTSRTDVHVVAAADGPFLFLYLHGVKVGDLALDGLNGLALVDGLHMEIDDNAVFRIEEVGQHFVRQLRGQDV